MEKNVARQGREAPPTKAQILLEYEIKAKS
jgi:hypothetical protein